MKISFFLCSEELLVSLRETLKSVKDIPHILKKFNSSSSACTTGDWTAFLKIFEVGISGSLREQMKYLNLDIVQKAGSCILTDLAYVYELVSLSIDLNISLGYFVCTLLRFLKVPRSGSSVLQSGVANDFNKMPENIITGDLASAVIGVIDVSRSKDKGYGTIVKEGFCDELDELRQIYEELPDFWKRYHHWNLLGFLLCLECYLMCVFEEKLDESTLENLQDFEFAFSDEDGDMKKFFYCTLKTRELDNLLRDIYHKILDMGRAITGDLVSQILLFSAHLLKALNFSAELDCTEMTIDTVIPNDTKIHDDGRINIITDAATVGLTDRIFYGTGLLGGTINHFITCYDPPKVLVCTHLTEMFNDSCIQESDNIKYYTMSVLQPDDGLFLDMHFLAMGCIVHYLLGVPEEVIKRAASLLNATGNNNHVNRLCNDKISAQDRQYKTISWFTFIGMANCCEPSKTALTKR
ncbi:unnamed protein product [Camellia sinensis]